MTPPIAYGMPQTFKLGNIDRVDPREHAKRAIDWPYKHDIFHVAVSATTYSEMGEVLIEAAKLHQPTLVDFMPVSVLVEAASNQEFRDKINSFDLVCPDGQPVRWCLNHFHRTALPDTVCGTTATLHLCERAAREGVAVYFYGSTPKTLNQLQRNLESLFPELRIVGTEAPPFRALSPEEKEASVRRINASGAGLVFIGIGSPRQEHFAWEQKPVIQAVQLCVGAAFDFIAGTKKRAPRCMQRLGLEWLHRLCMEPLRLGRRYASGNLRFAILLAGELLRNRAPARVSR